MYLIRFFLYVRRQFLPLCMAAKLSAQGLILSSSLIWDQRGNNFPFTFSVFGPPLLQTPCSTSVTAFWSVHPWEYTFTAHEWVPWFLFPPMDQCNRFLFPHMDQWNRFLSPHMDERWAFFWLINEPYLFSGSIN